VDKKITLICGESDLIPDFESIGNNPNFVFESDPQFDTLVLYNPDGAVINVNSWLECANYVNGGWESKLVSLINYEKYLFFGLAFVWVSYFIFGFFNRKSKYS